MHAQPMTAGADNWQSLEVVQMEHQLLCFSGVTLSWRCLSYTTPPQMLVSWLQITEASSKVEAGTGVGCPLLLLILLCMCMLSGSGGMHVLFWCLEGKLKQTRIVTVSTVLFIFFP